MVVLFAVMWKPHLKLQLQMDSLLKSICDNLLLFLKHSYSFTDNFDIMSIVSSYHNIVIILRHSYNQQFFQNAYILSFNNQHLHSISATCKLTSPRNVEFKHHSLTQYLFFLVVFINIFFLLVSLWYLYYTTYFLIT